MPIISDSGLAPYHLPGLEHRTLAGPAQGVQGFEVWKQTIEPGAATPVHRHACDEVIVVLSGTGACTIEGRTSAFAAGDTIVVPPDVVHQLVNTGGEPMLLVATFGMAPVKVCDESGEHLPLPWDDPSL